jgi:hypothetical protein
MKAGLVINVNKTKYMKCSGNQVKEQIVDLGGTEIGNVHSFKYLVSMVNINNTTEEEIKERISAGNKAYFAHKMLFMSKTLSKKSKLKLYNSVIRPTVTYASETWVLKKQTEEKLLVFERKIMRRIYGPTVDPNGLRKRRINEEINILLTQRIL